MILITNGLITDGVYGMAPSINYVCCYDMCNVIMTILNLTTIAILRQLLATIKWQSRQRRQLVWLKNNRSRRQLGHLGILHRGSSRLLLLIKYNLKQK